MRNLKEYNHQYYLKHWEQIRENQRVWKIKNRERANELNKKWYEKYGSANARMRYQKEPLNYKRAHYTLHDAVRYKKIEKQPCAICGESKVEGHHYLGYEPENWLTVQWLCRKHHFDTHGRSTKPLDS
jgi:hypothetical protein